MIVANIWRFCSLFVFVYEDDYEKEIFSIPCSTRAWTSVIFGENMIAVVFFYGEWKQWRKQLSYQMLTFFIILQLGESIPVRKRIQRHLFSDWLGK